MTDLDDFNRLVGYWRAHGLSEPEAHAKAEEMMEVGLIVEAEQHVSNHDCESLTYKTMTQSMGRETPDILVGGEDEKANCNSVRW